jgi:hypothetical protein
MTTLLRDILEADLPIFFEQQLDKTATYMAAFTTKHPEDKVVGFNRDFAAGRGEEVEEVILKLEPQQDLERKAMTERATGTFEVTLKPQPLFHETSPLLGRMTIDKTFHGDLAATSTGEMLSARTNVKDSAGYVAIERVSGSLHGRQGSFVLQHSSTLSRGDSQQSITVVPDSGTDELVGLSGSMVITIKDGKHFYEFDYNL